MHEELTVDVELPSGALETRSFHGHWLIDPREDYRPDPAPGFDEGTRFAAAQTEDGRFVVYEFKDDPWIAKHLEVFDSVEDITAKYQGYAELVVRIKDELAVEERLVSDKGPLDVDHLKHKLDDSGPRPVPPGEE